MTAAFPLHHSATVDHVHGVFAGTGYVALAAIALLNARRLHVLGLQVWARAAAILAGDGIRTLCADLDRRGVHPVQSERWHPRALHRMAMSARIAGLREHRGVIVGTAEWPAIISVEDSAKVRALFGDERRKQTREPRRYLLAGMLRCGKCGATLVSRARQDRTPRYVCAKGVGFSGCNGCMILAEPVEAWITEAVLYRLDSPQLARAPREGDRTSEADDFARGLEEDLAQLDELGTAYGAKQITMSEWLAARRPIEERIERSRKRLSRMTGTTVLDGFVGHSEQLRTIWNDLPLTRKRAIIAAIMDHAVIAAPASEAATVSIPNASSPPGDGRAVKADRRSQRLALTVPVTLPQTLGMGRLSRRPVFDVLSILDRWVC